MKPQNALNWLIPMIAILALITSGAGLFSQGGEGPFSFTTLRGQVVEIYGYGIYQHDTLLAATGFRGADSIVLFLGLPLLAFSFWRYLQRSLKGAILLASMMTYFMYIGASLTFSAAFNSLFLVYTALFSAGLFGLILSFLSINLEDLAQRVSPRLPRRGIAIFLFVAGLGTFMLWLSELTGPILSGNPPENLGPYTTLFTHGFDSALITPAAVLGGIFLLRRQVLGYVISPVILVMCVLNGFNVLAATASQTLAGVIFPPAVYVGMVGSWIVMGAFAIWLTLAFFRNLQDAPAQEKSPRPGMVQ